MKFSGAFELPIRTIAVTGGLGNLGSKLLHHFAQSRKVESLVSLDVRCTPASRLTTGCMNPTILSQVVCDLSDYNDRRWRDVVEKSDAVVHFAAQNPYPEATWQEAASSFDMTLNVARAAAESTKVKRVVFATSNHVMGRYKDDPLWAGLKQGGLKTSLDPQAGTVWHTGERAMDSTPYATAKLMGERVCKSIALSQPHATFVCVRIGWCQPGENSKLTLSASGTPTQRTQKSLQDDQAERWFKEMWLSNRDFCDIFEKAVLVDGSLWPGRCIVVNGMSNNAGMKWSLSESEQFLGYKAQDNVYE